MSEILIELEIFRLVFARASYEADDNYVNAFSDSCVCLPVSRPRVQGCRQSSERKMEKLDLIAFCVFGKVWSHD